MVLLEVNQLKLYVKDQLLFKTEQLQIRTNDRIGLVGKNGSGKTTLLEVLAEEKEPDQGIVVSDVEKELLPQLKNTHTTKSGGEVTQEYINKAIARKPELLFADEPTTNLDMEHVEWLEKKLQRWVGAFVLVSHDRQFLDALCTLIWEIDDSQIHIYKGNYSAYLEQKKLERHQQKMAYEKYRKK